MSGARDSAAQAARAALTQLEFEREAAYVPEVMADLPLPPYLRVEAGAAPPTVLPLAERSCVGGGAGDDVLEVQSGPALDSGAQAAAAIMPGDRIATTVAWRTAAEGETSEARRQRALHKQMLILQGLFDGKE